VTGPARPIAEDDLHACVDGVLAEERRVAVEHYLQTHPKAAERVAAYRAHRQALRAALSARMHDPISPTLDLARLLEARLRRRNS
jgi:anti-sigma factor RsiW